MDMQEGIVGIEGARGGGACGTLGVAYLCPPLLPLRLPILITLSLAPSIHAHHIMKSGTLIGWTHLARAVSDLQTNLTTLGAKWCIDQYSHFRCGFKNQPVVRQGHFQTTKISCTDFLLWDKHCHFWSPLAYLWSNLQSSWGSDLNGVNKWPFGEQRFVRAAGKLRGTI